MKLKRFRNFVHNATKPNTMRLSAGQMGTEEAEREGDDDWGAVAMEPAAVEESLHKRRWMCLHLSKWLFHSEVSVPALQESDVILYFCHANSGIYFSIIPLEASSLFVYTFDLYLFIYLVRIQYKPSFILSSLFIWSFFVASDGEIIRISYLDSFFFLGWIKEKVNQQ